MIAVCLLSLLLGSDWSCTFGAAGPLLALFLLLLLGLLGLLLGSDWFSAAGAVRPSGLLLRLGRSIIVRTFQAATVSFLKLWFLFFWAFSTVCRFLVFLPLYGCPDGRGHPPREVWWSRQFLGYLF